MVKDSQLQLFDFDCFEKGATMQYVDAIYGGFELPPIVEALIKTPEFKRLHDISMDTLPRNVLPYGVASRFEHCLGVVRLVLDVIANNRATLTEYQATLLLVSALLHDMANPALSHLTEPFLLHMTEKNGESFLEDVMTDSKTASILRSANIPPEEVVAMVTGTAKPLSDILHGSMDVDNLDNVLRYRFASTGELHFNARCIASSYRFRKGRWEISMNRLEEVRKWQAARREVYATIYGSPHIVLASMAYRAVDLVFQQDGLPTEFFRFTDTEAFNFLRMHDEARPLINAVLAGRRYEEILSIETITPEYGLRYFADTLWNARSTAAGYVALRTGIPPWAVCAYFSKGRDVRRIHLPFVDRDGDEYWDDTKAEPIYRLKIFVHPEHADNRKVRRCISRFAA